MDIDFAALMIEKSDDGLKKYIDDYSKYMPEAIEAAINELKRRGHTFSEKETDSFKDLLRSQKETIEKRKNEPLSPFKWDESAVSDENVPKLFSQRTIYGFAALFGVVTGAILLAVNIKRLGKTAGILPTICFGVLYSVAQGWILSSIGARGSVLAVSILGAIILNGLFWKKYIGKDTKYRTVSLIKK